MASEQDIASVPAPAEEQPGYLFIRGPDPQPPAQDTPQDPPMERPTPAGGTAPPPYVETEHPPPGAAAAAEAAEEAPEIQPPPRVVAVEPRRPAGRPPGPEGPLIPPWFFEDEPGLSATEDERRARALRRVRDQRDAIARHGPHAQWFQERREKEQEVRRQQAEETDEELRPLRIPGRVTEFSRERGYGFISEERSGRTYFVSWRSVKRPDLPEWLHNLQVGERVFFTPMLGPRGWWAATVTRPEPLPSTPSEEWESDPDVSGSALRVTPEGLRRVRLPLSPPRVASPPPVPAPAPAAAPDTITPAVTTPGAAAGQLLATGPPAEQVQSPIATTVESNPVLHITLTPQVQIYNGSGAVPAPPVIAPGMPTPPGFLTAGGAAAATPPLAPAGVRDRGRGSLRQPRGRAWFREVHAEWNRQRP